MATVFRISELKSKLDGWRTNRKSMHEEGLASADPDEARLTLVDRYEEDYDLSLLL